MTKLLTCPVLLSQIFKPNVPPPKLMMPNLPPFIPAPSTSATLVLTTRKKNVSFASTSLPTLTPITECTLARAIINAKH